MFLLNRWNYCNLVSCKQETQKMFLDFHWAFCTAGCFSHLEEVFFQSQEPTVFSSGESFSVLKCQWIVWDTPALYLFISWHLHASTTKNIFQHKTKHPTWNTLCVVSDYCTYLLSHTRSCASQSCTEVLLQEKYVNSMFVLLLLWRYLRTVWRWRHQIEDRWQTSFVLSSIIYLSIYIYLSGVAGEGQTQPRLLTATATALCGDRGDGVNSWVAATPSPATLLHTVHCILHYIKLTEARLHISLEVYEQHINWSCKVEKKALHLWLFTIVPSVSVCTVAGQLDTMQWYHWTVWMIYQSCPHMTGSD